MNNGLETGEIADLLLFFVSFFFFFMMLGGRDLSRAAGLERDFRIKNLGERIPQGSDIDIFCVFSDASSKNENLHGAKICFAGT